MLPKSDRRATGCFGVAFGLFFLLIGIGLMAYSLQRGYYQRSTASWIETQGEIVGINFNRMNDDGKASPITYQFTVNGNIYWSNVVAFVDAHNLLYDDWVALANGLPEKGPVSVFYNPDDPGKSVLRRGDVKASWNGFWFGAIIAGFAAFWIIAWWGMSVWVPFKPDASENMEST